MRAQDIHVGKTYQNRLKGRTRRTVLGIGDEFRPERYFGSKVPDKPGVEYEQNGVVSRLYLPSFASWAGSEVEDNAYDHLIR
jgi:hypothetical protein